MILLLKPVILAFVQSNAVKQLLIDCLAKLAKTTDNEVDDAAVRLIEQMLFPQEKQFDGPGLTQ